MSGKVVVVHKGRLVVLVNVGVTASGVINGDLAQDEVPAGVSAHTTTDNSYLKQSDAG